MGKKTPSTSRKQLRSPAPPSAPYVAKSPPTSDPPPPVPLPPAAPAPIAAAPAPAAAALPVAAPLLEHPPGPILPSFDLRAIAQVSLGFAEAALTALPAPAEVLRGGDPTLPEPPPGRVPPGDSRSLRLGSQFALVYRHGASVVSRRGIVGQRGVWRVVDYPGPAQAAAAYAAECSKLRGQGFVDLS